jgi:hypothetical protein
MNSILLLHVSISIGACSVAATTIHLCLCFCLLVHAPLDPNVPDIYFTNSNFTNMGIGYQWPQTCVAPTPPSPPVPPTPPTPRMSIPSCSHHPVFNMMVLTDCELFPMTHDSSNYYQHHYNNSGSARYGCINNKCNVDHHYGQLNFLSNLCSCPHWYCSFFLIYLLVSFLLVVN